MPDFMAGLAKGIEQSKSLVAKAMDAKPKLRVATYCRVSTDSDEQATSYDAQVEHYTELFRRIRHGNLTNIILRFYTKAEYGLVQTILLR